MTLMPVGLSYRLSLTFARIRARALGAALLGAAMVAPGHASYVRALSEPVQVGTIYVNEWGSPFITFSPAINPVCSGSNGLYLWNLEASPNTQLRNVKLATLLTAKSTSRRVRLDYFFDSTKTGWEACYIHGFYVVD